MAHVLLINSTPFVTGLEEPVDDEEFSQELTTFPPLGILYIAAVLEREGHTVRIKDAAVSPCRETHLEGDCLWADIVGVSITTPGYQNSIQIVKAINRIDPDLPIVVGGPHVTFQAIHMLSHPEVGIAVRGEGEHAMTELLAAINSGQDFEPINGITYRKSDHLVSTPDRPFIEDLDALPFPARHLVDLTAYKYAGNLVTGRGCPYRCQFCAAGPLSGYRYRVRSPENVVEEIRISYEQFGINHFFFADDTFTAIPDRTLKICDLLQKLKEPITWKCEARANTLTPALLKTMAEAGCVAMQIGVESGSNHILKKIQKGITTEMVERAVKWAVEHNISVTCSFIIGHPDDTVETVRQSIRFGLHLRSLSPEGTVRTEFALATPLPGSVLYENAESLGIHLLSQDWEGYNSFEPVIETRNLSKHQLRSLIFDAHLGDRLPTSGGLP
jgi:anaerobic magnesium-protoporphyrin IX monomethyl ester cyclase